MILAQLGTDRFGDARVVLASHLGRPKGPDPALTMAPVAQRLAQLLGRSIAMAEDCVGRSVQDEISRMQPGSRP